MNPPNKKLLGLRSTPQVFKPRTGQPQPFKPAVTQAKHALPALNGKRPVAPPVYRPQVKPVIAQAKMAGPVKTHPTAPAVYRPQPMPKVLQRKISPGQSARAAQTPRATVAPQIVARVTPAMRVQLPVAQAPQSVRVMRTFGPGVRVVQRAEEKEGPAAALEALEALAAEEPRKSKRKRENVLEDRGELDTLIGAFKTKPNWTEKEDKEGAQVQGQCFAVISYGRLGSRKVSGSYSADTGNHAEMKALANFLSAPRTKLEEITEIAISSPPCKVCKAILIVLGLAGKVTVPAGKGESHGSCKGFEVPLSVLKEVATKLKTTSKMVNSFLQSAFD
jgi:hypothetical protein